MKIKIKKLDPTAIIPSYSKFGDAGMDLTAVYKKWIDASTLEYGTGLAFEIPEGHVGLLFPRSSLSKKDLILANHVGVLDSGFRGEVTFRFKLTNLGELAPVYSVGDRIGQIIVLPYPQVEFEEVNELTETERGTGGYGSTGN